MDKRSFANGNGQELLSKEQRDSGWNIRPEGHWAVLTEGKLFP